MKGITITFKDGTSQDFDPVDTENENNFCIIIDNGYVVNKFNPLDVESITEYDISES